MTTEVEDAQHARWLATHMERVDLDECRPDLLEILGRLSLLENSTADQTNRVIRRHGKGRFTKTQVLKGYRELLARGEIQPMPAVEKLLQLKPTRTVSGVTPVAVLTKPFPCTGTCAFCPDLPGIMPTSYLPNEPGARRAAQLDFDPFLQTERRIRALRSIGHRTDKIELIVLGGTWSRYPTEYQEWFIRRCLDGMNGTESETLEEAQRRNERAACRNVGMVIETRPDCVSWGELAWLRELGVTKVQIGIQSLNEEILARNKRGHGVEETRQAFRLLRTTGFKIHAHWMPNLLGSTPESDLTDFALLWDDPSFRPDELKIYPCCILPGTEVYDLWKCGLHSPYPDDVLTDLIAQCKTMVPPYCRITRVMRDIPAHDIAAGCTRSNLRQMIHAFMSARGKACACIRCREVRTQQLDPASIHLHDLTYETGVSTEHFLSADEKGIRPGRSHALLAGFLRLSLPHAAIPEEAREFDEIDGVAMIREVHVYGPALALGSKIPGRAQHAGLGTRLLERAEQIAREAGFRRIAVISAIGTREYYRARGYVDGTRYMMKGMEGMGEECEI